MRCLKPGTVFRPHQPFAEFDTPVAEGDDTTGQARSSSVKP